MASREIEEFAKLLVEHVRDHAIRTCDRNLKKTAHNRIAERWRKSAQTGDINEFAKTIIPDIVDSAISHLLGAIDQELLRLSFKTSDGRTVDLCEDGLGELSGWYKGTDGWTEKYSKERYYDDFSDLDHFFDPPKGK